MNHSWKTETAALLVMVMSGVLLSLNASGQRSVQAATYSAANRNLALGSGEVFNVKCAGDRLVVRRLSREEILVQCEGVGGVVPTNTPVPQPTANPAPTGVVGSTGSSKAYGIWDGTAVNYASANTLSLPVCPKSLHDEYYVVGLDNKKYPTWHPATVINPSNGQRCTFGHEHGRNPAGYQFYGEIANHFGRDLDNNGSITPMTVNTATGAITAGDRAGIPFAYANEQLDAGNLGYMRHEDHVGHKVEYANGEGDIGDGTDPFDNSLTGGVVAPFEGRNGETKFLTSGVRCYHLHKLHQGVHSPDAFGMNMHELITHEKCTSTLSSYANNTTAILTGMMPFGKPGQFLEFCGINRTTPIDVGTTTANANYPTGPGFRNIMTKSCISGSGGYSGASYEDWDAGGGLAFYKSNGSVLAQVKGGAWEVLDAIRYYDPAATNKIGYFSEYRTGTKFNDSRSSNRGLHRGQYMSPPLVQNAGGPTIWYTNAMGENGQTTPFAGSVKQYVSAVNSDFLQSALNAGRNSSQRIVQRHHDDGQGTVHAPN